MESKRERERERERTRVEGGLYVRVFESIAIFCVAAFIESRI